MLLVLWAACADDPPPPTSPEPEDTGTGPPPASGGDLAEDVELRLHPDLSLLVVARWDQRVAGDSWLSWTQDGVERTSPVVAREVGPAEEVVLGVPADTRVDLTLHVGGEAVSLGGRRTGELPSELEDAALGAVDPARHRGEEWLLTSVDVGRNPFFGPCYAVVLDLEGRVVWYRRTSESRLTWQTRVSRRGGYVLVDASNTYNGLTPELYRLTLDLRRTEALRLPMWGIAYDELDDGTILYEEARTGTEFYLVHLLADGTTTRLWACQPWMEPWSATFWDCAANTVQWDPARQTVLWSMFQTSTVVELDLTGRIVAEYGSYPGGHDFVPAAAGFELQHFPNFTPDGTLIASTHSLDETEQWAREYRIDDDDGTLTEIWSARSPDYAEYAGQAQKLPSGNVLWQLGTAGIVRELARNGDVVWEAAWPGHLVGNVTPVADLYALTGGW